MQNELLMFQFTDACYWLMRPLSFNRLNGADQRSGRWQIGQHRFLTESGHSREAFAEGIDRRFDVSVGMS